MQSFQICPHVSDFHAAISRSLFANLGNTIEDLTNEYGQAYLDDFEASLVMLRQAFPEKEWPKWAAEGFLKFSRDVLREELRFKKTGSYTHSGDEQTLVAEKIYNDPGVMEGSYLVGLFITYFLWPHHYRILNFFRKAFLDTEGEVAHFAEWGVGHGLHCRMARDRWPRASISGFDLSPSSLEFTRRMLAGTTGDNELTLQDVTKISEGRVDRLVCSEVLEHVADPARVLKNIRACLAPGGIAFVTGAVMSPQIDHIYLFETDQHLINMIAEAGLTIIDSVTACHPSRDGQADAPHVVALVVR